METKILKVETIRTVDRGKGIVTTPLVTQESTPDSVFTTGMSLFPRGQGAPLHRHNCDEQVTLLEGVGEVEVEGAVTALQQYDSTYIPAGALHAFRNTGDGPMRILWIYGARVVTRTFHGSDEEIEHLSARDVMGVTGDEHP